jgi:hypothetical protein
MGYPMSYKRVIHRNDLRGGYDGDHRGRPDEVAQVLTRIAGDLRRMEANTRDARHLDAYARLSGVTPDQARVIFDAFFGDMGRGVEVRLDYGRVPAAVDEHGFYVCEMEPEPPIAEPYGAPWSDAP